MEVEVDFWENQRYKPLQGGWNPPYTGGRPPYSDITGKIPFEYDNIMNKTVEIPPGWEWSTPWEVDVSEKYGTVDEDGWSYSSTFDRLIEESVTKTMKNERSSMNIVRRRRWRRVRVCVDAQLIALLSKNIDWVSTVRTKIEEISEYYERIVSTLTNYRNSRKWSYDRILSVSDKYITDSKSTLEMLQSKLNLLKHFLEERGKIESSYSKQLEDSSARWMYAGALKSNTTSTTTSTSNTIEKQRNDSQDSIANTDEQALENNKSNKSGFFYVVSKTNDVVAKRKTRFAQMLSDLIPKDVDGIIQEMQDTLNDCDHEGQQLRMDVVYESNIVDSALEGVHTCESHSNRQMITESDYLFNSMHTARARAMHSLLDKSEMGLSPHSFIDPNGSGYYSESNRQAIHNDINKIDVWLSIQRFHSRIVKLDGALLIYKAFCSLQNRRTKMISMTVTNFLKSLVKHFAHEQYKIWQDSSIMLQAIGINEEELPDSVVLSGKFNQKSPTNSCDGSEDDEERDAVEEEGESRDVDETAVDVASQSKGTTTLESVRRYSKGSQMASHPKPESRTISNDSTVTLESVESLQHVLNYQSIYAESEDKFNKKGDDVLMTHEVPEGFPSNYRLNRDPSSKLNPSISNTDAHPDEVDIDAIYGKKDSNHLNDGWSVYPTTPKSSPQKLKELITLNEAMNSRSRESVASNSLAPHSPNRMKELGTSIDNLLMTQEGVAIEWDGQEGTPSMHNEGLSTITQDIDTAHHTLGQVSLTALTYQEDNLISNLTFQSNEAIDDEGSALGEKIWFKTMPITFRK